MRKTSEATGSQSENLLWKELKVGGFLKSAFFNVEAAENFNFLSFVSSLMLSTPDKMELDSQGYQVNLLSEQEAKKSYFEVINSKAHVGDQLGTGNFRMGC